MTRQDKTRHPIKISSQKLGKTSMKSGVINSNNSFPIVGIGASAGGLEAFIQVLSKMPVDTGMAFVLVQHLDPTHPSMSVEIISRSIELEIEEAKDGARVKPNQVYFIPPNYNMGIFDGVLKLSERDETPAHNMAIDFFFKSLAQSEKRRAIGVVLSGTGTDGTAGLWAIKAEGGVTYAQDPKSAKYEGMPQSAITAGVVDLVLHSENITKELVRMSGHPYLAIKENTSLQKHEDLINLAEEKDVNTHLNEPLHKIFNLLRTNTKVDFSDYKHTTIKRRIQRRMMVHKTKTLRDYAQYLQGHADEVSALYNDILINVTEFFRDPDSFKTLTKQVFPALLKNRPVGAPIRIWVPGCSTGEEVYSIAISLVEFLSKEGRQNSVQIFATDISEQAIQKARIGQYAESVVQNVSPERLKRFFEKTEGGYKIHKTVRDLCLFSRHDVTRDPPFGKLDLISCRNVLIYFAAVLQKRVIPIFHYGLNPGGFLWLGKSENPGEFAKLFALVDKTHKIYAKSNLPTPINFRLSTRRLPEPVKEGQVMAKVGMDFQKDADKLILSRFAPPSVIINSDLEILQFRGRTFPFLEPATGRPSVNLLKMARPELLASLRTTIQSVKKENKASTRQGLHFEADDGKHVTVDIEVLPVNPKASSRDRMFLVLFKEKLGKATDDKQVNAKKVGSKKDEGSKDKRVAELLQELSEVKSYQESLIEQYETTQEELTSANEELQSTNEEFQSTNEEIETSQEELQSTNEELITVNDELQIRNSDLSVLSSDLSNLLASIEIPVLIVGSDNRIRRFSPKAKSMFNLIPTDVGRPITDIKPNLKLKMDTLVAEVSESLSPKEIETQDDKGGWLRVQIRPYRTIDNKIDGVVIAVIDIDLLKQKEIKTKQMLEYLNSVAEAVPLPLAVVNGAFQFESANHSFYKYFQISDKTTGQDIFKVLKIQKGNVQNLRELLSQAMGENKKFQDFEIDCDIPNVGTRKILCSGGKIHWAESETDASLISFMDVTKQRQLEEGRKVLLSQEHEARRQAEKNDQAKDIFLATLSHELRTPLSSILTWAQLITRGKVDFEKAKEGAAIIERSARTQSQLIDDMLDISRIIAGKLALKVEVVTPSAEIRSAIESVRPLAEKKSIQIKFDCKSESDMIRVDSTRLQQIIWNLLSNSIKFSPDNSVVFVTLENIETHGKHFAQIKVLDQGKGIPPEFLPQIFSQFSQADSSSTRVHGGLGLGLSIVRNLVELQNGTVIAENAPDSKGAIFTVMFPIISPDKSAIVQTAVGNGMVPLFHKNGAVPHHPKLDGLKVLYVDDDESAREAICIYLKSFGAEVTTVGSASEALKILSELMPNILISDIAMPGEDGYSLIKKIRGLSREKGGGIPALALTAYATDEDAKHALTFGFQRHLRKPVEADELGRVILSVSDQKIE